MTAASVPVKTAEGQAELQTRKLRISQRHRTVLFLVDGRRPEHVVRELAAKAGAPDACFDELLNLGLIAQFEAARSTSEPSIESVPPSGPTSVLHIELPLFAPTAPATLPTPFDERPRGSDGEPPLPPSLAMPPESTLDMSRGGLSTGHDASFEPDPDADVNDSAFMQARELMMRSVRTEAPVSGSLTLRRLRRARSRVDLLSLLGEVEARISKPFRSLAATQTLESVRDLLARPIDSSHAAR